MKRHLVLAASVIAILWAAESANAQVNLTVYPSIGPNAYNDYVGYPTPPTLNAYTNAAMYAMTGGAVGSPSVPNTPGAYSVISGPVNMNQVIATSSPSWLGNPNPTGAFAMETGNNLYFGFHASSANPGQTFTLSQVSYNFSNSNPANTGLSNMGQLAGNFLPVGPPLNSFGTQPQGQFLVGYNSNLGQYYTSSADDNLPITDLFYVGPATGFNGGNDPIGTNAQLVNEFPNGIQFSGGTVTISGIGTSAPAAGPSLVVPEPASMAILAVGAVGLLGYTYRRRRLAISAGC